VVRRKSKKRRGTKSKQGKPKGRNTDKLINVVLMDGFNGGKEVGYAVREWNFGAAVANSVSTKRTQKMLYLL